MAVAASLQLVPPFDAVSDAFSHSVAVSGYISCSYARNDFS